MVALFGLVHGPVVCLGTLRRDCLRWWWSCSGKVPMCWFTSLRRMGCSREPGVGSYWRQLVVGSWGFQSDFWVYELGARRKPTTLSTGEPSSLVEAANKVVDDFGKPFHVGVRWKDRTGAEHNTATDRRNDNDRVMQERPFVAVMVIVVVVVASECVRFGRSSHTHFPFSRNATHHVTLSLPHS